MLVVLFAVFFILHGLVHLLYLGQSQRFFELQPGMTWPDGSWLFSRFLSPESTRLIASVLLVLAALAFAGSGLGLLLKQDWWRPLAVGAAGFSSLVYLAFWDGTAQRLDNQGFVGILLNLAVLGLVLLAGWPHLDG
jgi:hypothetical protein